MEAQNGKYFSFFGGEGWAVESAQSNLRPRVIPSPSIIGAKGGKGKGEIIKACGMQSVDLLSRGS